MNYIDPLIGRQFGQYRIDKLIGRGGMAKVYQGWDAKLQRLVAIKIIDERYRENPIYTERFLREARLIATLRHPNILRVYSAGQEDDFYYIVFEYVNGVDLEKVLHRYFSVGQLPPQDDVLLTGRAIANALDYAHSNGIVHRDVKPSNIIVADNGRIYLTDFGLAMNQTTGTMGEVFGSPHYISPEQARNSSFAVPQSDLYSLGVVLYEMLTGSTPFDDPSPAVLALQHVTQDPPPPRSKNPALSPAIEAVLYKALQKNPQDRYQTGAAMINALQSAIQNSPAETQPTLTPARTASNDGHGKVDPNQIGFTQQVAAALAAPQIPPVAPSPLPTTGLANPPIPRQATANPYQHPRRQPKSTAGNRWVTGCIILLAISALLIIFGILLTANNLIKNPFFAQAGSFPSGSTTPVTGLFATATGTSIPPTNTPTSSPTPMPTFTPTSGPLPTIDPNIPSFTMTLMSDKKADGIFLINTGNSDIPLAPLLLDYGFGQAAGTSWNVSSIQPGDCVALLKTDVKLSKVQGITCNVVGNPVYARFHGRFTIAQINVYFQSRLLTSCQGQQNSTGCPVQYTKPSQ